MYRKIRKEARKQRRALIDSINERLKANEAVNLPELHKKLEPLAKVENLRTLVERGLMSTVPLLVAIALLGPLWLIRQENPVIELSAVVSRVVVYLDTEKKLELNGFGVVRDMHVEGLDSLDSDVGSVDFTNGQGDGIMLTPGPLQLGQIVLTPMKTDPSEKPAPLSLAISRRGSLGQLAAQNFQFFARASVSQDTRVTSSTPEAVLEAALSDAMFELEGPDAPPSEVRVSFKFGEQRVDFPVLKPTLLNLRDLAFDSRGEPEIFSSIEQASLLFTETGRTHEFFRGTSLALQKLDGDLRITLGTKGVEITYHGMAGLVALGGKPGSPALDLRPRLAEWISSDRTAALLWSTLIFLAGLVLTVRRSLLG